MDTIIVVKECGTCPLRKSYDYFENGVEICYDDCTHPHFSNGRYINFDDVDVDIPRWCPLVNFGVIVRVDK